MVTCRGLDNSEEKGRLRDGVCRNIINLTILFEEFKMNSMETVAEHPKVVTLGPLALIQVTTLG